MGYGVRLLVSGDYACFTRPEMKGERVSYDVITPSAARGVLEAIYWKPAIRWVIDRITVLNPIRFDSIRRNELGSKVPMRNVTTAMKGGCVDLHQYIQDDRQQRATLFLKDVSYIIDAHFEMITEKCGAGDTPEKHYNIFIRRARNGQCFHNPYLGCREFPAKFKLLEENVSVKSGAYETDGTRDLGWMLWDISYSETKGRQEFIPRFFRAIMQNGVIEIPKEAIV